MRGCGWVGVSTAPHALLQLPLEWLRLKRHANLRSTRAKSSSDWRRREGVRFREIATVHWLIPFSSDCTI